ncbi:LysM peptidoglycan-binding domain-containing protein [Andreprevotia chitinilytica]|uniref:LysM peptidoglycan-binding domain-containing protein n=1 Tax=Andreprevotia chitinilytica TaxID=396808 RepID=UPI0005581305|nr:LysM peptidoglycan-binding domain-containing protein [Andreprevotia chitinilytica]
MRKTIISLLLAIGAAAGSVQADTLALQNDVPDRYVVVKGDTLWGISGKFLKQPWRWPEIWQMNKEEIKNPHWIYPGDVVVLDRSSGQPRLKLLKSDKVGNRPTGPVRLSPQVRIEDMANGAVSSIPYGSIQPFLKRPLLIEPQEMDKAPRIAAGPDNRVVYATGDKIYATNLTGEVGDNWQVFHPSKALIDPDDPDHKRVLGYEVKYLGEARVEAVGEVSTMRLLSSAEEIVPGDRLVHTEEATFVNYVPHAPAQGVKGRIVSAYGGIGEFGQYATVVVNKGSLDGLDIGSVLFTYKQGRLIKTVDGEKEGLKTPPEKNANLFIYRVFPSVSYGLLLDTTSPVNLGDEVRSPPN